MDVDVIEKGPEPLVSVPDPDAVALAVVVIPESSQHVKYVSVVVPLRLIVIVSGPELAASVAA
jgi:hypothetical protein